MSLGAVARWTFFGRSFVVVAVEKDIGAGRKTETVP